ncbi:DUF4235 domain-containing protein [Brachybacterium sp. GPGPB12]|uniref:DUF4235 domain-containing protein n=1 Tax=Brachybacterium sp. GPGPB12 TaxID=3023517 RepID=UPI0031345A69
MANPLVSIIVPVAGIIAASVGKKAAETGWGVVFGEDAPTTKSQKAAKKDVAARRKQAKKDGASKAEIQAIRDPDDDQPVWKLMLWTLVSGVLAAGPADGGPARGEGGRGAADHQAAPPESRLTRPADGLSA